MMKIEFIATNNPAWDCSFFIFDFGHGGKTFLVPASTLDPLTSLDA
jgi:hypothetical protein